MRRKDRQKDTAFALEVLRDCGYANLATVNPDGTPYCIPVSIALHGNAIYFHCATEGRKLTNISHSNAVCISAVRHTRPVPEDFTTQYESAVATGKCHVVQDKEEKILALRAICEKYAGSNMEHFERALAKSLHRTCVCRVDIEQISGKSNP